MLHQDYPFSDQDQVKLLEDGWTLALADRNHKQIISIQNGSDAVSEYFDTQSETLLNAKQLAEDPKTLVSIDGTIYKPGLGQLLAEGYLIIRARAEVSTIFYCSSFGSWRALERVDADRSLEDAIKKRLEDPKTILY